MFQNVLGTGVACTGQDSGCASHKFIRIDKFSSVSRAYSGQTEWMLTATHDGWSAVLSRFGAEVTRHRERGTRRGCDHGGIVASGATLEETL
eukprot:2493314-Pleurochrysis_carterae.AAC.1